MANLDEVGTWLSENLSDLLAKYKVPGAAIGVYSGGQVVDFAAGVLSHATGVAATTDSVFQIGSITKTWTGTLVMQLADEGLLDIDKPVVSYLPDFDLADSEAARTMTVRQLLNHTAGFEGDIFTDTGTNDDCVEKYVATLATDPQLFAPGEMFSYNNAGYCVLGRIVEVLREKPFDQALRDHLFTPLGLTHAATDASSAILFRAAIGHLPNPQDPDGNPVPAPIYNFAKSNAPAGSALAMRPRDLLAFAAMHLNNGAAADGTRVLSKESVARHAVGRGHPPAARPDGRPLGPELGAVRPRRRQLDGQRQGVRPRRRHHRAERVPAHRPRHRPGHRAAHQRRQHDRAVLRDLRAPAGGTGRHPDPCPPAPAAEPQRIDAAKYVGTYANSVGKSEVTQDEDGRIWMTDTPLGELAALVGAVERTELVYLEGDTLIPVEPKYGLHLPQVFMGDDGSGRSLFIHTGRALRRA